MFGEARFEIMRGGRYFVGGRFLCANGQKTCQFGSKEEGRHLLDILTASLRVTGSEEARLRKELESSDLMNDRLFAPAPCLSETIFDPRPGDPCPEDGFFEEGCGLLLIGR